MKQLISLFALVDLCWLASTPQKRTLKNTKNAKQKTEIINKGMIAGFGIGDLPTNKWLLKKLI
jgi:hypothetical protein